jgi:protein-S-isoprenylcysteine O-methyltransferase Ste14
MDPFQFAPILIFGCITDEELKLEKDSNNMKKLVIPTLRTFLIGAAVLGILLFLPAWTLNYWQAWVFIVVFGLAANAIGIFLSFQDPALLERRKKVGPKAEQNPVQKIIMSVAVIALLSLFVFAGLDHRFGWSVMPLFVPIIGEILVLLGFLITYFVFKENSFGASNITTEAGQKVISTGPYTFIRHPMYAGVLVLLVGVPLALGSFWCLLILAIAIPGLVFRILDEEKLLKKELPGYTDYMQKVRYRLLPFIW